MKSALLLLRESRDSMSATERAVSDYLLSHQGEVMELSIHQLAEKTFASPSTVIRMCQRIGFAGYREFRQAATWEMAARGASRGREHSEITRSDSLDDIVDKVTCKNIMSLEGARGLIDTGTLRTCVELLRTARTVLLFGLDESPGAVRELSARLLRLDKPCRISDDRRAQMLQAQNAAKEDLAIVVSPSGERAEAVECMRALREKGAPIIAITRRADSPVAGLSDYRLYTADDEAAGLDGTVSQLNLIDILFTAFAVSGCERRGDQPPRGHFAKLPAGEPA